MSAPNPAEAPVVANACVPAARLADAGPAAEPAASAPAAVTPDVLLGRDRYFADGASVWQRLHGRVEQLTNFRAWITAHVTEDDGTEPRSYYELEGQKGEAMLSPVRIPVAQLDAMTWPAEHWGAHGVVVTARKAPEAAEAIKRLSPQYRSRRVLTHTGWRQMDRRWVFLHHGGAVGSNGAVDGVEMRLPEWTQGYRLEPTGTELQADVRASLALLDGSVVPIDILFPLYAAVYLAPLSSIMKKAGLTVWVKGISGSFKTTLASLMLSHYGKGFDWNNVPAQWSNTANATEEMLYTAKDLPLLVDDFVPGASKGDVYGNSGDVQRVIRATANRQGRGRLNQDGSPRASHPPRGLLISTGEDLPAGMGTSIAARMIVVESDRQSVDLTALTTAQHRASEGVYARAMTGYIAFLAQTRENRAEWLSTRLAKVHQELRGFIRAPLARTVDSLAQLWVGFTLGVEYAAKVGAISGDEKADIWERGQEALERLAARQSGAAADADPARRYLESVAELFAQGKVRIARRGATSTDDDGELIGWHDDEYAYLLPAAAHREVKRALGGDMPWSEAAIRERLYKAGLLDCEKDRHTSTVRIEGLTRRVLRLRRDAVSATLGVDLLGRPEAEGASDEGR